MKRTTGHWVFKTDLVNFRTGEKAGICKHYVWGQESHEDQFLVVEKRIVEKARADTKYIKILNGIGFRIEPLAFKMDTLFAYMQCAVEAKRQLQTAGNVKPK